MVFVGINNESVKCLTVGKLNLLRLVIDCINGETSFKDSYVMDRQMVFLGQKRHTFSRTGCIRTASEKKPKRDKGRNTAGVTRFSGRRYVAHNPSLQQSCSALTGQDSSMFSSDQASKRVCAPMEHGALLTSDIQAFTLHHNPVCARHLDLPLIDQVRQWDTNTPLPDDLRNNIHCFAKAALGMELQLYQFEFIVFQDLINELEKLCSEKLCSESSQPGREQTRQVQQRLININELYPNLLKDGNYDALALINLLFDMGIVKGEVEDYGKLSADKILATLFGLKKLPFELFTKICTPLLKNEPFRSAFFHNCPELVIGRSDSRFLEYWESQVREIYNPIEAANYYSKALAKTFENGSTRVSICPRLVKEISNSVLLKVFEKAICHDYPKFMDTFKEHIFWSDMSGPVMALLANKSEDFTPSILAYFHRLSHQDSNRLLLAFYRMDKTRLLPLLLDNLSDISALTTWRDQKGRTLLHYKNSQYDLLDSTEDTALNRLLDNPEFSSLLTVRDHSGKRPLESMFSKVRTNDCFNLILENTVFMKVFDKTLHLTGLPEYGSELLNALSPEQGFQAWLLIRLVQKGLDPEALVLPKAARGTDASLRCEFKALLTQCKPLKSFEDQRVFLTKAKALGFDELSVGVILQAFALPARVAFIEPPFTASDRKMWESEVIPFAEDYIFDVPTKKTLPWTSRLKEASLCFEPTQNAEILKVWSEALQCLSRQDQLIDFDQPIPQGDHGIYGRSCFFTDPETGDSLRLKFRKKQTGQPEAEPWEELASEPVKLNCLRAFQQSGKLPLKSHFPEPAGMYRIPDFQGWLLRSPLGLQDQQDLREQVFVEPDASACVYVYKTKFSEYYHLYPYDVNEEDGVEALKVAAHDLGLLAGAGLTATVLPMYHDRYEKRHYVILAQLDDKMCPGVIESWDFSATNWPNISPGVGLRDYPEVQAFSELPLTLEREVKDIPENRRKVHMEQIAREFLSLILLLARTRRPGLDFRKTEVVEKLEADITRLSQDYFGQAFNLPTELIGKALGTYGIAKRLALQICFFCEGPVHPEWVQWVMQGKMPKEVFPKMHEELFDASVAKEIVNGSFFTTSQSQGANLGSGSGMLPLMDLNKLITLAFNLFVHKEQALATFFKSDSHGEEALTLDQESST